MGKAIFRSRLKIPFFILAPAMACFAMPVTAETHAVLVGVSDYLYLDADLKGPVNDVALMAQALTARGIPPENITILTSDRTHLADTYSVKPPERNNILAALDDLANVTATGDTAVFYFSGHGSQAPDIDGDEQGGHDEIFLPSDAKNWKGAIGAVENAIVDDELREKMTAITQDGAQLVGIVDACHSGTGFRAIGAKGVARYVDPESLGIPQATLSDGTVTQTALDGEFVFFYSSQSDQRSFEYPLTSTGDSPAWYGDFTRNIATALQHHPDLTYGQLLEVTRNGMRRASATATQTPDAEGPLLDTPVFGSAPDTQTRLSTQNGTLLSGALDGLTVGAEIAIFDSLEADQRLGTAKIISVTATTSKVTPSEDFTLPETAYAEILHPGAPEAMVIAPPVAVDTFDGYYYRPLEDAIDQMSLDGVVLSDTDFDAALFFTQGGIAITGPDGVLDPRGPETSPRFFPADNGNITTDLHAWIERAAQAFTLRRALALAEGGHKGFSLGRGGVKIELARKKGQLSGTKCTTKPAEESTIVSGEALVHCDQLWLEIKNLSTKAQDITVLYIDGAFQIDALWPQGTLSNRLASGETKRLGFQMENWDHDGLGLSAFEELIVLSVPATADGPRTVLNALAETSTPRDTDASGLETYLRAATSPDTTTRAISLNTKISPLKVHRFGLEILPQASP